MLIYRYHETTKEYLYSEEAYEDPAESEAQGKFVPMIPANATLVKVPNLKENQTAIFDEKTQKWKKTPDYRGKMVVDENFDIVMVYELGDIGNKLVITEEQQKNLKEEPEYYVFGKDGLKKNPNLKKIKENREKEVKKQEILQKLNDIDLKSIRAIRNNDTEYLEKYEKEAEVLRKELSKLIK